MATGRIADAVAQELRAAGDRERAEREKAYLKSALRFYGVPVPAVRRAAKALHRREALSHAAVLALVGELWRRGVHELRTAAVELLVLEKRRMVPADLGRVERLIRESKTWALVDPLAISVAGGLVADHPELAATLDRWAVDDDFWIRRSSMLALLGPLRAGAGDFERFARFADAMLDEKEFFIRKAIGWVLRETGKKRPALVADYVEPRAARASGVTLREAVKPLSAERRERILAKRRGDPSIA